MVTLKDIAREAGVSYAAVSYILNNAEKSLRFNEKTREKVKRVAGRLGYHGDDLARSMVTGKTRTIGFLASNTATEFAAGILGGAMEAAAERDYSLRLFSVNGQTDMSKLVGFCERQRLAGAVCYNLEKDQVEFLRDALTPKRVPLTIVSNCPPVSSTSHVYCDGHEGGRLAVEYLYRLGHRRLAHISTYSEQTWSADRREGFSRAAADLGLDIPEKFIVKTPARGAETPEALKTLFADTDAPTAIFCNSDFNAANVLLNLARMNLAVPEDVSLIGYGDLFISRSLSPQLTTINEPFARMGRRAIETLLDAKTDATDAVVEKIAVTLIERDSTQPLCQSNTETRGYVVSPMG